MKWYKWVMIVLFTILMAWGCVMTILYVNLKSNYYSFKNVKTYTIDSLNWENNKIKQTIITLEEKLKDVDNKIESNVDKIIEIKREEFVVSPSLSKSTELLKKNLSCVE